MFKKILIANRGEIACRIIKTARRMGIKTVAVYSEADRDALARRDGRRGRAHRPAARRPVLSRSSTRSSPPAARPGAEAVHPGYGFLSEREAFPVALEKAGIVFIGPNPRRHRRHGRQDRIQEGGRQGQGLHRARPSRRDRRPQAGREDRRRDRLSRDDQGLGRRRRQGHAHRLQRQGVRRRLRPRALGSQVQLRRRPHLHREVHRQPAPHRDPGAGRQARQRHLSRRARVLHPAPQPEGHRGGAVAAARREDAQGHGRRRPSRWPRPSATTAPAPSSSSPARTAPSSSWR